MPTPKKEATVEELTALLRRSQVAVLTDYRGMTVATITQLRRQLRDKGVEYHVTKNTLMTRAAHEAGLPQLEQLLTGPTAIAFVGDDIAGGIKALNDFVRTSRLTNLIRGALFGPSLVPADQANPGDHSQPPATVRPDRGQRERPAEQPGRLAERVVEPGGQHVAELCRQAGGWPRHRGRVRPGRRARCRTRCGRACPGGRVNRFSGNKLAIS